ncbi:MAG: LytTR family transcriptional regulator [Hellea sp.]|nr:LytTR family transcriptional regulator [Hellea sp.]
MEVELPEILKKSAMSGLGIALIAGVILSILGPYDTLSLPVLTRFIYWTSLSFIGGLGAYAFVPLAKKMGIEPSSWKLVFGQSITASIAVTACLIGLNLYRFQSVSPLATLYLFFFVWIISIVIASIAHLAETANRKPQLASSRAPLIERIKPSLRSADIYALTAEDHYVRVITSRGDDLLLMRLGDAIKEAAPIKGLSVHRSWWVAEGGVKSVDKSDGKMTIKLRSGQSAPVSRSNQKQLRDSGWA